jgi:ABC-type transport system involved in multi-copper enzyme maturation permease subunit
MNGPTLERIGLGPVFVYDWITASRRWQGYVLRSAFLLSLLAGLLAMWINASIGINPSIRALALIGESFYTAVAGTQLVLVLLAAPAATAGAICLDRARGTLAHMLMTDLSDVEIVLGKLAARLVPVLALVACTLPMMEVLTLIGGIDPAALWGAFVVSVAVAVLGCSLALLFSLWVGKTHEALLATYAVWCLWLLARPMVDLASLSLGWPLPTLVKTADPFFLVLAPYVWPGRVTWSDYFWFLAVTGLISALLVMLAILRVRAVCTRETVRERSRLTIALGRDSLWKMLAQKVPWISPSLDRNPVLWREWRRSRPTRLARAVTAIYVGLSLFFSILIVVSGGGRPAIFVNGLQVVVGLLFLSVTASTSLAEERVRGSLDLLLSTSLSTREIVLGKWFGAYRAVPLLAILPTYLCAMLAYEPGSGPWWAVGMFVYMLCAGAAVTSLGLAMATWFSRPGRAVGVTVTLYVLVAVGWLFLMMALFHAYGEMVGMASPFMWAVAMTFEAANLGLGNHRGVGWAIAWTILAAIFAAKMLDATLGSFDRKLGRIEAVEARLARGPRLVRVLSAVYLVCAVLLCLLARDSTLIPIAASLQFTLGTCVVAGTAALPLSKLMGDVGSWTAAITEISPGRIIIIKWVSAIRQMWLAILIPLVLVTFSVGPENVIWREALVLAAYMLASCAVAASLGTWLRARSERPSRPVFHVLVLWALLNASGFAILVRAESNALALGPSMHSPFAGVAGMSMAIGRTNGDFSSAIAWGVVWSIAFCLVAALLLVISLARSSRTISSLSHGRIRSSPEELASAR